MSARGTGTGRQGRALRLTLDTAAPRPNHAGILLARERGIYGEAGIELDLVVAGEADVVCTTPAALMERVEAGESLCSVAALNRGGLGCLLFDRRNPVDKLIDLEGRRVAVPPAAWRQQALVDVMQQHAGYPDRVQFVRRDTAPRTFSGGPEGVGAAWGYSWAWDGVAARRENEHIGWYTAGDFGAITVHEEVLVVSAAAPERELLRAFCAATARGYAEAAAEPEAAAWVLSAARAGVDPGRGAAAGDLPVEVIAEAVSACATTWQLDDWGRHDHERLDAFARWMTGQGLLTWSAGHGPEFRDEYLPAGSEPA